MDTIKLERLLNGACIILIAITFAFVVITLAKAHNESKYGKVGTGNTYIPRTIEGKYTVIEDEEEGKNVSPS